MERRRGSATETLVGWGTPEQLEERTQGQSEDRVQGVSERSPGRSPEGELDPPAGRVHAEVSAASDLPVELSRGRIGSSERSLGFRGENPPARRAQVRGSGAAARTGAS